MIVLNILGYFGRNKQNSYAALKKRKNIVTLAECSIYLYYQKQNVLTYILLKTQALRW